MMHYLESESQAPAAATLDTWQSLRQAIAQTSGFQRWQAEQKATTGPIASEQTASEQEAQIDRYLREALATLAY